MAMIIKSIDIKFKQVYNASFKIHFCKPVQPYSFFKDFYELQSVDAAWWYGYMDESCPSRRISYLSSLLEPGDLCYVVYASDQDHIIRSKSGMVVTITTKEQGCYSPIIEVCGNDETFIVHPLDLMKIQLDASKPRVYHWNLDEKTNV